MPVSVRDPTRSVMSWSAKATPRQVDGRGDRAGALGGEHDVAVEVPTEQLHDTAVGGSTIDDTAGRQAIRQVLTWGVSAKRLWKHLTSSTNPRYRATHLRRRCSGSGPASRSADRRIWIGALGAVRIGRGESVWAYDADAVTG
jgi:hypothetical protein